MTSSDTTISITDYLLLPSKGTKAMTITINAEYAIASNDQQKYPALQADNYQPRNIKETINICLSEQSVELLSPETITKMDFKVSEVTFGDDDVNVFIPQAEIGWCILAMPRPYLFDKETSQYSKLQAGVKLAGTKKVTAAKVFMCGIIDGQLLLDTNGIPQVFTLNLKSSKTRLLKAITPQPDDKTIYSLNTWLNKTYKVKGWVAHLASVDLWAVPEKFTSSVTGDSSLGIYFTLGTKIELLSDANQKLIFDRLQDPELKSDISDPYGLASQQLQAMAIPDGSDIFPEPMPF
jgi:hypothetical protein